jgi:hypothetical protein
MLGQPFHLPAVRDFGREWHNSRVCFLTDCGSGIQFVLMAASKERAAVLLKDVLQDRLAAVPEVGRLDSGGVKAALRQARAKLRMSHARLYAGNERVGSVRRR